MATLYNMTLRYGTALNQCIASWPCEQRIAHCTEVGVHKDKFVYDKFYNDWAADF
jgi:hypothetical protein